MITAIKHVVPINNSMRFNKTIIVGHHTISESSKMFVIAEAGVSHNGCFDTAKKLIDAAGAAGGRSFYERLDCCYIPKSHAECIKMIKEKLRSKSKLGAMKYGYWSNVIGTPFNTYKRETRFDGQFPGYTFYPKDRYISAFPVHYIYTKIKQFFKLNI